ncbi:hypothetical protein GCM10011390_08030 [Aureimonas endophytica]|uniref:PAS domain S-box-containing protein/diguanylate cyclase (GGDEF)-like protein n=1 Tax=Aureimonas endophytica TaxID=2027858 RepID=A0A916ZEI0_9HYPH|nr:PAS domain S-box protein [Aureimonas endophytica]GGD91682.1 hypothetical protein GCM10011390_08030 [Aureimonas endophytica]
MRTTPAEPCNVPAEMQALNRSFATLVLDAEGRIARANNRFLRLFGYELEEIVGRDVSIFAPKDDTSGRPADRPRVRPGENWTKRLRRLRKDGSELWVESHFAPIRDADGRLIETAVIVSDVSDQLLRTADDRGQIEAIDVAQAVVHFAADGTVLAANALFLHTMGYAANEVIGRHHRMFVAPEEAAGEAYADFWTTLAEGRHQAGEYRRIGKDGREIWLQATYSPIFDPSGRLSKIVKYATDVTAQKLRQAEYQWQIAAIHKSQAVAAFDMQGAILDANALFLEAFGYSLDEVRGRHHRMFVEPAHAHSSEYAAFWRDLRAGRHRSGQYRRIGKDGREVWLQATYNPIFDMNGRAMRVVKYASIVTEERLQQAEHEGQIAAIHQSQCVVSYALDGTILDANDNFLETVGYRYSEILGKPHRILVPAGAGGEEAERAFWATLAKGEAQAGEFRRVGRDGRDVWLQATYSPILDMGGRPFKVVQYAVDITGEKLRRADFEGQIAAIHKSQGVITLALDGTILDANDNILAILGYDLAELRGRHHTVLVEPGQIETDDYRDLWDKLRSGAFHSGLYKRRGKDGRELWLQATYNPVLDLDGRPFKVIKFASDVTENVAIAEAYEDAKRQAQHDPATALPNRARLASFMTSALPHPAARMAVLYIDLDRFKPINDTYGHPVGDRVLGEIADRLRRLLKDDQIVARVGGDEFVIAAPNLGDEEIETLCLRLLASLSAPIRHEDAELAVTASIGIAIAPSDATSADELLRCADAALYRSKQDGRNIYSYYSLERHERIAAHRSLAEEMRRGISVGEFFLEYQPRYETNSRAIRSVEALVRWAHPERGRISPADFIPLAERSGLIVPLGEWILRTACQTVAPLDGIGVSVNVSPVQFRDDDLVAIVASALAESGLAGSRLELEITEGVLMEDAERARGIIGELKALGVKLAMDDFGTGYSSMSYLCDFPFDVIKIDRKFIADIEGSGGGRAVVQAILGLGRSLGLSVTAEGVETNGQLALLARDQCREVQGYLLARPMPEDRLRDLVAGAAEAEDEPDARDIAAA